MFPTFTLLNAAALCCSAASQFWIGAGVNALGIGVCVFFALAVERMEDAHVRG